jgi:hypothetical protein
MKIAPPRHDLRQQLLRQAIDLRRQGIRSLRAGRSRREQK